MDTINANDDATTKRFFGVGAAHLGGVNGVINLLRGAGYSVEPFVAK
jgi:hypothetical protein